MLARDRLARRVTLSTDIWISENNIEFMVVTAHRVTTDFKLQRMILDVRPLEGSHTGDKIAHELEHVIEEWALGDAFFDFTTDNTENINRAVRLLAGVPENTPGSRPRDPPPLLSQSWHIKLSDALKAPLIELRDFLMPFDAITKFLEGSLYPTMAAVVPQYNMLLDILDTTRGGHARGAHALDLGEERVKVLVRECLLQYQTAARAAAKACLGGEVTSARGVAGQGAAFIRAAGPRGARACGVLEFQAMLFAELAEMEAEEGVRA
ncbi:unnamed protein product [Closterium sp. NIES-65]|nr:unnamed protein product [Closterium sp. NIES-65]